MAYTPINWQTGDTITAEKLNRCDNGWGYESTQLFSETVTTADNNGMYRATFAYAQPIDADTITVTFDGTEYTCQRIDAFDQYFYGGFGEQDPVFTEYPFCLASNSYENNVYTETASTHTIAAAAQGVEVSENFSDAVNSIIPPSAAVLCVPNITNSNDVAGKALPFFFEPSNSGALHIITNIGTTCTIFPESSTLSAHFGREDGLFYIIES